KNFFGLVSSEIAKKGGSRSDLLEQSESRLYRSGR
ncbi:unnamed protein product, partial [marine sediment metagenome]